VADRDEVEREFRRYFMTGPVLEDWQAWANLFTDDAKYFDHYYGTFTGPPEITAFLEGTMGAAPQVYSPLLWYVIDGDRVAYKVPSWLGKEGFTPFSSIRDISFGVRSH
jgi:hypothetical protein